jgi:hypothetical protein
LLIRLTLPFFVVARFRFLKKIEVKPWQNGGVSSEKTFQTVFMLFFPGCTRQWPGP